MRPIPDIPSELIETIADRAAELAVEKLYARREAISQPALRRAAKIAHRDIEAELAELLARTPGLTVPEIGRTLRTRQQTIRQMLETNGRFSSRSGLPGRSPKARGWFRAPDSSPTNPAHRTSDRPVAPEEETA